MTRRRLLSVTAALLGAAVVALVVVPGRAAAQPQVPGTRSSIAPGFWFDMWSFGGPGVRQPSTIAGRTVRVTEVYQYSVPLGFVFPLSQSWSFDVSTAYASGRVTLAARDSVTRTSNYTLSGLADTKLRLTGPLGTPNLLFTLGINAPTGMTKLNTEQLNALRVLASPALGLHTPVLGIGLGATAGLVFAKQTADYWGWAFGVSYEKRGKYNPLAQVGGVLPELTPSDAVRFSIGGDGLVGQNGLTVNAGVDVFTQDKFMSGASGAQQLLTKLGPIVTTGLRYHIGGTAFRDLTLYAVDRFRSSYQQAGKSVPQSSGNYLDAGISTEYPIGGGSTALIAGANVRHHTGLKADSTLSTAALLTGGLTLGLSLRLPNSSSYAIEPMLRAQAGSITNTGAVPRAATGISFGVQLARRF